MKIKSVLALMLIILMQFIFIPVPTAHAFSNPAAVPLLTVSNFAALGHTAVTSPTGPTILNNGDLGVDTPGTCTDFAAPCSAPNANGTINNGAIQFQNAVALQGQTDATAAVTNIGLRTADQTLTSALGGSTLTQGVYDVPHDPTANITGDLTLSGDANSVFIFHLTSDLVTATGSRVLLTGGVQACNVFWKVDSSATFNGTTTMVGTVLAQASVTFPGGGATLAGRAVAQTGAITFNNTTVNNSSCAAASSNSSSSSSSSSSSNSSSGSNGSPACVSNTVIKYAPTIVESRRISPTSVYLRWTAADSGLTSYIVQYGFADNQWLYNTIVQGLSTTINNLPANQPVFVKVAATADCGVVGNYGVTKLIGGPLLPNTGINPNKSNIPWNITIPVILSLLVSTSLVVFKRL